MNIRRAWEASNILAVDAVAGFTTRDTILKALAIFFLTLAPNAVTGKFLLGFWKLESLAFVLAALTVTGVSTGLPPAKAFTVFCLAVGADAAARDRLMGWLLLEEVVEASVFWVKKSRY